ncbi:MAG: HlyD family secretion protein [Gammaproteobacteria bacterium]|nr:HlyD family secretion protein [Rhodospirillales bacterium]MDA8362578.1 HlyD family secretion protein [Gammaproteobacteria bacterium]
MQRLIRWKWAIAVLITIGVIGAVYAYWRHSELYPNTDDAYVNAHVVQVAAQVSGPVSRVYVSNQQRVHRDQPLFSLDPATFHIALARMQARLALARQGVSADSAMVVAAEAAVADRRVLLDNARVTTDRIRRLRDKGFVSAQAYDNAEATLKGARAQLNLALAKLRQAQMTLGNAGAQNERVREAEAAVAQAQLDLRHTHVSAACTGRIAKLSLRPGDVVQGGVPLFTLVCSRQFWIDANFKETEVGRIRPGQPASISVDMYPDHPFRGRVEHISGAAGTAFSLLPPENATGNWVKVTQRVPVRVAVIDPDSRHPLRVGTSAEVTIDTTGTALPPPGRKSPR